MVKIGLTMTGEAIFTHFGSIFLKLGRNVSTSQLEASVMWWFGLHKLPRKKGLPQIYHQLLHPGQFRERNHHVTKAST